MNEECAGEFVVELALQGRVPVKVSGKVRKGDLMVSAGEGVCMAWASDENPPTGSVIGKAVESSDGSKQVIEVVVGRL